MPGKAIREARKRAGLSQAALAIAVGVEQGTVARWESGNITVPTQRLRDIAAATGVSLAELMDPGAPAPTAAQIPPALRDRALDYTQPIAGLPRDLPVLGSALAADLVINVDNQRVEIEQLELGLSDVLEYVRRPLAFALNSGAYALYVAGSSMEPRYEAGDMIYVDPRRPPAPGDDIVVQLRDNGGDDLDSQVVSAMIKRLVRRSSSFIEVQQYNPPLRFSLPMAQVSAIHRVTRLGELMGR